MIVTTLSVLFAVALVVLVGRIIVTRRATEHAMIEAERWRAYREALGRSCAGDSGPVIPPKQWTHQPPPWERPGGQR